MKTSELIKKIDLIRKQIGPREKHWGCGPFRFHWGKGPFPAPSNLDGTLNALAITVSVLGTCGREDDSDKRNELIDTTLVLIDNILNESI